MKIKKIDLGTEDQTLQGFFRIIDKKERLDSSLWHCTCCAFRACRPRTHRHSGTRIFNYFGLIPIVYYGRQERGLACMLELQILKMKP